MSLIKSTLVAGGMLLALASSAFAQGGGDPWDLKERMGYVLMMDGTMKQMRIGDKGMAMLMKSAKKVPRGTMMFMSGGQLYMVNAGKMFDKAGGSMFGF